MLCRELISVDEIVPGGYFRLVVRSSLMMGVMKSYGTFQMEGKV